MRKDQVFVGVDTPCLFATTTAKCAMETIRISVRGQPFDSEGGGGGGWHFWSRQIIYFHHVLGRKIYCRVNRGHNIYFQPQQIFEKAKKKKKKKKKKIGGGVSARV